MKIPSYPSKIAVQRALAMSSSERPMCWIRCRPNLAPVSLLEAIENRLPTQIDRSLWSAWSTWLRSKGSTLQRSQLDLSSLLIVETWPANGCAWQRLRCVARSFARERVVRNISSQAPPHSLACRPAAESLPPVQEAVSSPLLDGKGQRQGPIGPIQLPRARLTPALDE